MPTGFSIGPLYIHFYGILIMLGALAAAWLATVEARRKGENPELVWDMLVWLLIGGIIGARLWHILTPPASMQAQGITTAVLPDPSPGCDQHDQRWFGNPGRCHRGLPWPCGGTRAGSTSALRAGRISSRQAWPSRKRLGGGATSSTRKSTALRRAFPGRSPSIQPTGCPATRIRPPTTHYSCMSSIWNLANAGFLLWFSRKYSDRLKDGDVFLVYLITYPVFRFFMEFIRLGPLSGGSGLISTRPLWPGSPSAQLSSSSSGTGSLRS